MSLNLRGFADLSVRAKLVAMCLLLVLALSALLLVQLPRALDAQSRGWVVSRSLGLGRLLANALEASVDFDDDAAAARVLDGIRTSRGAIYAVVLRSDGSVLARWGKVPEPALPALARDETAAIDGARLNVQVPILARTGRAGTLLLAFGLEELEERRSDARRSVLLSAALFVAIGVAAALVIGSLLSGPLVQITEAARRVALGQDPNAAALPVGRRDEVGILASSFRHMLEQLDQQRAQINQINADLAERVRERTQELARTNAAMAELERTQEQLVMADRRVSVGRLAAGVAHEVNNPMASLSGNLEFVASELGALQVSLTAQAAPTAWCEAVHEAATVVGDCRRSAGRVVHIVRSLKTFARGDEDQRQVLCLDGPMEAAIDMAMHEVKHRARLERRYGVLPHVLANEVRLSQVFLNLLINAAQAIPDGDAERHQICVALDTDADGRAVAEVSDTGCGMTPEVMERIFDPFFTTKAIGVGSGLGLPISRNIVQKLDGEITVQSQPGQGTTFRIVLPGVAPDGDTHEEAVAESPPDLAGLRLLVVDDEPDVSEALVRLLSHDVHVVTARGGREALELLAREEAFDVILCDIMMPDLSGPEFHAALVVERPAYRGRTIFMTGGVFTEGTQAFVEQWDGPLLEKPLDAKTLRRTLHALRS
jgi:signal transduction histidine kinase